MPGAMPLCFSLLIGRGVLDEYSDDGEEHADSKDTTSLGQFLEQLKHPSHDLLVAIWQDQYCVQGRVGRQRPKGHLHLLVHCLVETSATAEQHACIRANPCLHLVARLSQPSDPFCPRLSLLSRHIYELSFLKYQSCCTTKCSFRWSLLRLLPFVVKVKLFS